MKNTLSTIALLILTNVFSQSNTFPNVGDVGIGTTSPDKKLHVKGMIKLQNENPELIFSDNTGSTFNADFKYINNKLHYRWGDGIKHTFELDSYSIGDYHGVNEVKISAIGSSWFNGGKIGIGTSNPGSLLDISNSNGTKIWLNYNDKSAISFIPNNTNSVFHISHGLDDKLYFSHGSTVGQSKIMTISNNGNVGIGKTNPTDRLEVNGTIHAKEVRVDLSRWSDFVFEKNYNLPSLKEVERQINQNGHLHNIPSAKEVQKEGIKLGEMNAKLLQKIEELTLYLIEQNKRIEKLELKNIKTRKSNEN